MMEAVSVEKISKSYKGNKALDNISFSLKDGEILGVIGPNGAGKTTTLKIISGLVKPDKGTINVFGSKISNSESYKKKIGYMPEESAIYENLSLNEYLHFFGKLYGVDKQTRDKRISNYRKKLNLNEESLKKNLGGFSKGMKRKALLIRSLINDPDLLIYDEPASGLDPVTAEDLLVFIGNLDKTMVMTAHNLSHVEKVCDRVIVLNDGEIEEEGNVEDIGSQVAKYRLKLESEEMVFDNLKELKSFIKSTDRDIEDLDIDRPRLAEMFLDKFQDR